MKKSNVLLASIFAVTVIAVVVALLLFFNTGSSVYQVTGQEDWLPQGQQGIDWYVAANGRYGTEYQIRIHRRRGGPKQWIADGLVEIRDSEDVLVLTGHYSNGKRHGEWTTWSVDRSSRGVATWNHGVIGDEVRYDHEGHRTSVITYLDNKPQKATHYSHDGQVSSIIDYTEGTIRSFADGQITDTQPLE